MKYKLGDSVRFDGGEWWFYGSVSAVFEHSVSPCYRIDVERMEKKNCKFSITQFEFDLDLWHDDKRRQEFFGESHAHEIVQIEQKRRGGRPKKAQTLAAQATPEPSESIPAKAKRKQKSREINAAWEKNFDLLSKGQRNSAMNTWISYHRRQYAAGTLSPEKHERLASIGFSFESEKGKGQTAKRKKEPKPPVAAAPEASSKSKAISAAWERCLESYIKGEKSQALNNWASYNRKLHKNGTLSKEKQEKLSEIGFSFDAIQRKQTIVEEPKRRGRKPKLAAVGETWLQHYESFQKGEKSNQLSSWVAVNRKEYRTGELSEKKLDLLLAIKFPFEKATVKKTDSWHRLLDEWKKGNRRDISVQQWKQRNIKKYVEGKLDIDKIARMKEAGILK